VRIFFWRGGQVGKRDNSLVYEWERPPFKTSVKKENGLILTLFLNISLQTRLGTTSKNRGREEPVNLGEFWFHGSRRQPRVRKGQGLRKKEKMVRESKAMTILLGVSIAAFRGRFLSFSKKGLIFLTTKIFGDGTPLGMLRGK